MSEIKSVSNVANLSGLFILVLVNVPLKFTRFFFTNYNFVNYIRIE